MLAMIAAAIAHEVAAADVPQVDLTGTAANVLGRGPFGKLVKYGYALMVIRCRGVHQQPRAVDEGPIRRRD
jgi:hypothetical protein